MMIMMIALLLVHCWCVCVGQVQPVPFLFLSSACSASRISPFPHQFTTSGHMQRAKKKKDTHTYKSSDAVCKNGELKVKSLDMVHNYTETSLKAHEGKACQTRNYYYYWSY
uniref:Putative secreted protein n=1 Tax=Anopheles triannulatus TaxID=58253 RepID=A0A2M4B530_9DIPT